MAGRSLLRLFSSSGESAQSELLSLLFLPPLLLLVTLTMRRLFFFCRRWEPEAQEAAWSQPARERKEGGVSAHQPITSLTAQEAG